MTQDRLQIIRNVGAVFFQCRDAAEFREGVEPPFDAAAFRAWAAPLKADRDVAALVSLENRLAAVKAKAEKAKNAAQMRPVASEAAYLAKQAARYKDSPNPAAAAEAVAALRQGSGESAPI